MDPRLLLGKGARATRTELRAAHRRLRSKVAPSAGGTHGLVELVDAALDVALTGRDTGRLTIDPHAILGVARAANDDEIRLAYRRVARVVHPDRGGTDELFRVVAAAHEILTGTVPTRRSRRRAEAERRWSPPPPPAPRGPYRAPDPASRHAVSRARAWEDAVVHGGVLVVAVVAVAALTRLSVPAGIVATVVVVAWFRSLLRPSVESLLRAVVVLRGSRVRVRPEIEPERFLEDRCLDAPVGRQREDDLYDAYVAWCRGKGEPVAPWVFVERLRGLGLLLVRASAWDAGLWVGVTLRR
ncbi:MAG TPA: J domain-containing protein [Acidimicrobiales bacterium]|nr:J domain-containing protein [Acidimicrobiales bacterium]